MDIDPALHALIERCSRLWSAEAEVFRTYFDWPLRTVTTDREWVLRQVYKELLDGFAPSIAQVNARLAEIDSDYDRDAVALELENAREEFNHYAAFAALYEALFDDGQRCPGPETLRREISWPENDALVALRSDHRRQYGALGWRAQRFTEGGYCTLFSEGMKLAERGGIDSHIAAVCASVYDDEFEHMLSGIADLAQPDVALDDGEWRTLSTLVMEQLAHRLHMRQAQFSHPVEPRRLRAMLAGDCEPLAFDYRRAFGAAAS